MRLTSILRTYLEWALAKVVIVRHLPSRSGKIPLVVSGRAGLRYFFRRMSQVDPTLVSLVHELVEEGKIVWDVGANVGLFAFSAAAKTGSTGSVIAFEPDIEMQRLLHRSVAKQQKDRAFVEIIPVAITHEAGIKTFCIAKRSSSANYLEGKGTTQTGGVSDARTVSCVSLDWVSNFRPPPNILKIDVEGAEIEALKGAVKLLEEHRPIIICEVAGENSIEVFELLTSHGYRIFDGETKKGSRTPLKMAPYCTVALPPTS